VSLRQHQGTADASCCAARPRRRRGLMLPATRWTPESQSRCAVDGLRRRLVHRATQRRPESKGPGPAGSGPAGCKSPASRRPGSGDGSAGRSAASRDGRRALIARSQDLPCPNCHDAARERPEYSRDGCPDAGCGAFPIVPVLPQASYLARLRDEREDVDRTRGAYSRERRRSPAVPPLSPRNDDRPPARSGGDRLMMTGDESRRDAWPARGRFLMVARLVTLERDLPLPTAVGIDVRSKVRGRRPESPRFAASRRGRKMRVGTLNLNGRTVPVVRRRWSEACAHRPGTLVPAQRGTTRASGRGATEARRDPIRRIRTDDWRSVSPGSDDLRRSREQLEGDREMSADRYRAIPAARRVGPCPVGRPMKE
jgi:hypothetical protein